MDFGVLTLAQINAIGLARHAEARGFTHWWVGEGQLLFSVGPESKWLDAFSGGSGASPGHRRWWAV
jgi:hypothetical protein